MLIYIVRHGETMANVEGFLQGWLNQPLNEAGRYLATITGQGMKDIHFDFCISSPLIRARETAELILKESGNDIPVAFDDRLKEINFGEFEGKDRNVPGVQLFFDDPFKCPCFPDGEDIAMLIQRTQAFLRELIEKDDGKTYMIVTHGTALRAMLNCLYEDKSNFWQGHVPYNCCANIVEAVGGKAELVGFDRIYYPREMIVDRYK